MPVHSRESLVGSHRRPTSGHIEPIGAFDSSVLPGIQTQPDTSTDIRNLVRIEGVSGSMRSAHQVCGIAESLATIKL
jgi:hypothetical protein